MANYLLKPVYRSIFGRDFQPDVFEDRLEMQKTVYLLQNMGISVGEYRFMWYKHGPYSQTLQNDILNLHGVGDININFSADAKKEIETLKNVIFREGLEYEESQWVECLGSLHYIKEYLLPSSAKDEAILNELKNRKPHLSSDRDNKLALQILKELAA